MGAWGRQISDPSRTLLVADSHPGVPVLACMPTRYQFLPGGLHPTSNMSRPLSCRTGSIAGAQDVLVPDPIGRDSTPLTIAEKELRGVGERLERPCVTCFCDSQVVVASLSSKTSKHPGLMYLIRCLVFVEVKLNFTLQLRYINTREIF